MFLGRFHIPGIGRQDGGDIVFQGLGNGQQGPVLLFGIVKSQLPGGFFGLFGQLVQMIGHTCKTS